MKEIAVDWNELELAFREVSETQNYFDLISGTVVSVVRGYEDENEIQTLIHQDPQRYRKIEPLDASFAKKVTTDFLQSVSPKQLRAELELAMKGPAGLTRSLTILKRNGGEMNRYHRFEQESFLGRVHLFLKDCGVKPLNRAPEPALFHEVA